MKTQDDDGSPPKQRRRRLPAEQRRNEISNVARGLFAESGFDGAKTRDIAAAAGVTETVVFRYFGSKEAIFEAAILDPVEQMLRDLIKIHEDFAQLDAKARFEMSQRGHRELYKAVEEIAPLLGVALYSNREAGMRFYQDRLVPLFDEASRAIGAGMHPRQQGVISPRNLFLAMLGSYLAVAWDSRFRHRKIDVDRLTKQMTEIIAFGLFQSTHDLSSP